MEKAKKYWLSTSSCPHYNWYCDTLEEVKENANWYFDNVKPYGLLLFEKKETKQRKCGYRYNIITGFTKENMNIVFD